jgi:hypothetical protein
MAKWDNAEKYHRRFLDELANNKEIASCCQGLGSVARSKKDYESSLKWYYKSLQIKTQSFKFDKRLCTRIGII